MNTNKKYIGLFIVAFVLFSIILSQFIYANAEDTIETEVESDIPQEVDDTRRHFLGVIFHIDEDNHSLEIHDIAEKITINLSVKEIITEDSNDDSFNLQNFKRGDMVNVIYNTENRNIINIALTDEFTTEMKITEIEIDGQSRIISVNTEKYSYTQEIIVLYKNDDLSLERILLSDTIIIKIVENIVWYIEIVERKETITDDAYEPSDIPSTNGYLNLEIDKTATIVFINGNEIKNVSQPILLEFGSYEIRAEKDGYEIYEQTIHFKYDGQKSFIDLVPIPNSKPYLNILLIALIIVLLFSTVSAIIIMCRYICRERMCRCRMYLYNNIKDCINKYSDEKKNDINNNLNNLSKELKMKNYSRLKCKKLVQQAIINNDKFKITYNVMKKKYNEMLDMQNSKMVGVKDLQEYLEIEKYSDEEKSQITKYYINVKNNNFYPDNNFSHFEDAKQLLKESEPFLYYTIFHERGTSGFEEKYFAPEYIIEIDKDGINYPITENEYNYGKKLEESIENYEKSQKIFNKINSDTPIIKACCLKTKKKLKTSFPSMDFTVCAGDMIYISGKSGAGKTTLLKILAGYEKNILGNLKFFDNYNWKRNKNKLKHRIGYVPQISHLYKNSSLLELMNDYSKTFYNDLKGERKLQKIINKRRIQDIINNLDLSHIKNTKISSELSGGECKRISVAIELVRNPEILILDEPDSGLDEYHRESLYAMLDKINEKGITIILSTHCKILNDDEFRIEEFDDLKIGKKKPQCLSLKESSHPDSQSNVGVDEEAVSMGFYEAFAREWRFYCRNKLLILFFISTFCSAILYISTLSKNFYIYKEAIPIVFVLMCASVLIGLMISINMICEDYNRIRIDLQEELSPLKLILSKTLVIFLLCAVVSIILIIPYIINIYRIQEQNFIFLYGAVSLTMFAAAESGLFISTIWRNKPQQAAFFVTFVILYQMLFSGFIFEEIRFKLDFLSDISISKYSIRAIGCALLDNEEIPKGSPPYKFKNSKPRAWDNLSRLAVFSLVFIGLSIVFLWLVNKFDCDEKRIKLNKSTFTSSQRKKSSD